ncbi:Gfo/Idh/MocA family protein [Desulfocurvibacter africanus]|uniref:Oxidoreductase domain protein n=2 Tax=Desulfocurvibacter africanus TaxID=873 RepID=F3Z0L4_DESAF|nr:Gfo/Idh/MocA family oxidoreductase [Desulfocurvibacter africanus]EGJ49838.1 oxidoreductase domain protein [Desulfocurvibacter africanus subsp. africanus str. Walvis Bay]EMG35831.1 putative dehydrogenase [Desulfocurvibacter africanus PCS]
MRVGVIGLGWMGKVHLRIYSELRGVEVVGVMDVDDKALAEAKDKYGVPTYKDLDTFLGNKFDAVSVCVPTFMHHKTGMAVIERGIPLLLEKPLAKTAAEGLELVNAAKAKGIPLMTGHVERFNPAVGRIRELIQDNGVISIQIERVGPYPPRIQDVGVIRDLASHDIDLIRYISGSNYKNIYAVTSCNIGQHEDTVIISAEMENGVLGQINCNWITPYKSRQIHVATKTRYIEGNLITQQVKEYSKFETYQSSYNVREWPVMFKEPVREELTAFLGALESGKPMPITGEDGLNVLQTIERVDEAIRSAKAS